MENIYEEIMNGETMTEEEKEEFIANEDDLINALIHDMKNEGKEIYTINLTRNGNPYLKFDIHPLSEGEFQKCRERHTKYKKAKGFGGTLIPEKTDVSKYRAEVIIAATTEESRKKLWNNAALLDAAKLISSVDLLEKVLRAGEKDEIYNKIQEISGFVDEEEEGARSLLMTAKN